MVDGLPLPIFCVVCKLVQPLKKTRVAWDEDNIVIVRFKRAYDKLFFALIRRFSY